MRVNDISLSAPEIVASHAVFEFQATDDGLHGGTLPHFLLDASCPQYQIAIPVHLECFRIWLGSRDFCHSVYVAGIAEFPVAEARADLRNYISRQFRRISESGHRQPTDAER